MVQDEISFRGHHNVLSLHPRTIEITKADHLTPRGDCIVGVSASKACSDIDDAIKRRLRSDDAVLRIELLVGDESFVIHGSGDSRLSLLDRHDIVIRKTRFVCPRTLSVGCDGASSDIPRNMVRELQDDKARGIFRITVE
jgi:hypothetical protein